VGNIEKITNTNRIKYKKSTDESGRARIWLMVNLEIKSNSLMADEKKVIAHLQGP
jgi:hypothetical protein